MSPHSFYAVHKFVSVEAVHVLAMKSVGVPSGSERHYKLVDPFVI